MGLSIWKPLIVDRIAMCVGLGTQETFIAVRETLYQFMVAQKKLLPYGKIVPTKSQYGYAVHYRPNGKTIASLSVESNETQYRFYKLELFPSAFSPGDFETLKTQMSLFFPCALQVVGLYQQSNVSRVEFAVDSLSHQYGVFIPMRTPATTSEVFKEPDGTLGTIYLGSKTSALRFRFYDKRRQLIAKGWKADDPIRTRFEARLMSTGFAPVDLTMIKNPFLKIQVANTAKAKEISSDSEYQWFLVACERYGYPEALRMFNHRRKEFRKYLNAATVNWWHPDLMWKGLPNAMDAIAP